MLVCMYTPNYLPAQGVANRNSGSLLLPLPHCAFAPFVVCGILRLQMTSSHRSTFPRLEDRLT